MDTKLDRSAFARISGSLFIALCSGLSDEGIRLATDVLRDLSENPQIRLEEQEFYGMIADRARSPMFITRGAA
jgi:hypothetical protein